MLNNKKRKIIITILFILVFGGVHPEFITYASEGPPYTTYTYDKDKYARESPTAFEFNKEYDGNQFGIGSLTDATDIFVDSNKHIYIVDTGNNRLVVLDENFVLLKEFSKFWNPEKDYEPINGIDELRSPSSVFVTNDGSIYIADTENSRLVVFDQEFHYVREILAPQSVILGETYIYKPFSVVVDSANRIYVMSKNDNQGVLELSLEGEFIGYFGAQSVKKNFLDWVKTFFMSAEQKSRSMKFIPRTYNSMAIDNKNFIWLTSNSLESWERYSYLTSKDSKNAVVKRLNPNGTDVLTRNGIFAPGGDLTSLSSIVDVAMKPNGIYTLLDNSYNKLFTYDASGNLLYAFGGKGMQDGVMTLASAFTYFGDDLLVLDKEDGVIVQYKRTEYGKILENAILADNNRDFELSRAYWSEVLNRNQNLELAYRAMGNNYLRSGEYEKAMEYFKYAEDKEGYSKAYRYVRTAYVKDNFLLVIAIPSIAIALWLFFTSWVKKQNKKIYAAGFKQTLKHELLYAFRVIYHPFDGFWEIKREKRGSVRAATIILAGVIFALFYKAMGTAYLFRDMDVADIDVFQIIINVMIPLLLWCLASWGLTTLFSGEGSMRDIYIMTCYSMTPVILFHIPVTVVSNFLVNEEAEFLSFFIVLGYIWMVILIFIGSMIIHDYHFSKNAGMVIFSIVGMGAMLFLALLFVTLGQKIIDFLVLIYEEIAFRF